MTEQVSLSFTLDKPYEAGLRLVRSALSRHGLRTAAELDITTRIRRELGANVAPCVVLYVDDPSVLLEAIVFDRGAALAIPQPLLVTGSRGRTDVFVRHPESSGSDIPESGRDPLLSLRRRMLQALESVADE